MSLARCERRSIIAAAYRCLVEPHTGPVPMSAILAAAGVSSRTFYRHFTSKDEVFLALLQQHCDAIADRLDRVAERAEGDPADQLADWIGEMFAMLLDSEQRQVLAVIDSEEVRAAGRYREVRERSHADRERSLVEILRRGRCDGSFPLADPEPDAVAISAVAGRMMATNPTGAGDVERAKRRTLDFALRALGAACAVGCDEIGTADWSVVRNH
ncbi:TetR/AcrR family transcriptional regulator [Mycolicibacterium sp.]|uniref:TetR/AcrR family transcriptional regulator n=1 Tax=Mycolicibacterium sp. TaxID=2320850 RepID=UPI003D0D57A9